MDDESFANGLGIELADLREHLVQRGEIPRLLSARAHWLLDDHERRAALRASGLPECTWITQWAEKLEGLTEDDVILQSLSEADRHAAECYRCVARAAYLSERFPLQRPYPHGGWMAALQRIFGWLAPYLALVDDPHTTTGQKLLTRVLAGTVLGGFGAAVLLAVPAALLLIVTAFAVVFGPRPSLREVAEAVAFGGAYIASGAVAGAVGGALWKALPGVFGELLVGCTGMLVFMFGLIMTQEGIPTTWATETWFIWGILSLLFGCAATWGIHRGA